MTNAMPILAFLFDIAPKKPVNSGLLAMPVAIGVTFFLFFIGLILFLAYREKLSLAVRLAILFILPLIGATIGFLVWQTTQSEYQKGIEKYNEQLKNQTEFRRKRLEELNRQRAEENTNQANTANR